MKELIKREIKFLGEHIAVIILGAFLAAAGGVILWINGGSTWFYIRTSCSGGTLGIIFSVWVLTYGLSGAGMAVMWLTYRCGKRDFCKTLPLFCVNVLSYLFMLVWYALFFCTRLGIFAGVMLILSCLFDAVIFISMRKSFFIFQLVTVIVFLIKLYFVIFTFIHI